MDAFRNRLILTLSAALVILLTMTTLFFSHFLHRSQKLIIGAKDIEGQLVGEVVAQLYEARTHEAVERKHNFDGTFLTFNALTAGSIDLYMEYTGTIYSSILKKDPTSKTREQVIDEIQDAMLGSYDLNLTKPVGFSNSYVLLTRPELAKERGLYTLSDLKEQTPYIKIGLDPELCSRPEFSILTQGYKMRLDCVQRIEHTLLYLTLLNQGIDVISGYSVDSPIRTYGFTELKDDRDRFPSYDAIFLVRNEVLNRNPDLSEILQLLCGQITLDDIRKMNHAVEEKGESVYDVAHQLITEKGFLNL